MKRLKKIIGIILAVSFVITGIPQLGSVRVKAVSTTKEIYPGFIKADGTNLKNEKGETVYLRGVNAGGYMLQEIWLCATYGATDDKSSGNIRCQKNILDTLNSRFGSEKAKNLISAYEDNYWTTGDFENCAKLGINCIRLPIWYRNLVDENGNWYDNAFDKIDWFVETAGRYGIYVIIDMHGAYGSQNGSHNSGIYGGSTNRQKKDNSNLFFGTDASTNQAKYLDMWLKIAQHYKDNPVVAGYDLLNEPMADYMNATDVTGTKAERLSTLWNVYDKAYKKIRTVDRNHVIIMEAVWDADTLPNPSSKDWTNVMYEYHQYLYSDYSDKDKQVAAMQSKIDNIKGANYNVPSYIGEFNMMSNSDSWSEGVKLLNDNNLSWTIWNYKCTKQYGNWGLFNTPGNGTDADTAKYWANVETDSDETILSKWSNQGSVERNTNVTDKVKSYFPGTVDNLAESKIKSVSLVNADGMLNQIDVNWYPKAGMADDTKYNIYIDDSTTSVATISKSDIKSDSTVIKATDYTNQNGVTIDKDSNKNPVNIGGTHNGDWVEYKDISVSKPITSVTFNYSCDKNANGTIYVYDKSMDSVPIGSIKITPPTANATWSDYVTKTIDLYEPLKEGKHIIYLKFVNDISGNVVNLKDFTLISSYGNVKLENVAAGKHKVTVQATLNEQVSKGTTSNEVEVVSENTMLKSDSITVEGFQIKTNGNRYYNTKGEVLFDEEGSEKKVAFRTICKAPDIGQNITVSGKNYTVKNTGVIYTIDPNSSGNSADDVLDNTYSILNTQAISGNEYTYRGARQYNNMDYTYGYVTTDNGILSKEDGTMKYVRTMSNNSYYDSNDSTLKVMTNSFHVRGFVVAEDGTLIYGTDTVTMSIPEVANYLYKNVLSSNYNGHAYLYDTILSKIDNKNPYYCDHIVDYGWNDNLYDPGKK